MTEANLDLQLLWPSYQSQELVYCLHSSARSVHNSRNKQLHVYLATLGAVAEFEKVCTQFEEKPAVHSPR